jgi:hypothetical protein
VASDSDTRHGGEGTVSTLFLTDTSDTVLVGIEANWGNYGNWTRRSESLVTRLNRRLLSSKCWFHRDLPKMV